MQYKPPSPDDFVNLSKYNVSVFALIVALPWRWGQRQSNIVVQWSHEWGGGISFANINMDSILMSVAVWGIRVKLYDISLVKRVPL